MNFVLLQKKLTLSLLGLLLLASFANANHETKSALGIDGSNSAAIVWLTSSSSTLKGFVEGAAGNPPWTPTALSNPSNIDVYVNPIIAVAQGVPITTRAVAVWIGKDLSTHHTIIQATILDSASSWNTTPVTLSPNDGSESKHTDINASISEDGHKIIISWTSVNSITYTTVVHSALSTDGGVTWSTF